MIGSGGHAGVLVDILMRQGQQIHAICDPKPVRNRAVFEGILKINSDTKIFDYSSESINLINGVGMSPNNTHRMSIAKKFRKAGYHFDTVKDPTALVSSYAEIGEGSQILSMSLLQPGVRLGLDVIVNSGAIIEHDCYIGNGTHIAPSAVICGGCHIGDNTLVGANATIINNVKIGESTIIAAGATVHSDVPSNVVYFSKSKIKSNKTGIT